MEDDIKIDLKEVGSEVVGWIDMFQNRDGWQALEDGVVNLRVQ